MIFVHNRTLDLAGATCWLLFILFVTLSQLRSVLKQRGHRRDHLHGDLGLPFARRYLGLPLRGHGSAASRLLLGRVQLKP